MTKEVLKDAKIIFDQFMKLSVTDSVPSAKLCAILSCDIAIQAITTTTGHCELRRLDQQEVKSDLRHWTQVKEAILNL